MYIPQFLETPPPPPPLPPPQKTIKILCLTFIVQSNLALREIFVTAYLSLKVKFLLKSSFRNIISEPYISPTEKRKPFFPLSLLFPTAFNHNLNWFLIINFNQFWFYNQLNDSKHNLNWFHFNISHFIMNKHDLEMTPSIILIDFILTFPIL